MNNAIEMSIATVERETGIGKDTLRVWERRYGFPQPLRDSHGERLYPQQQVDQLRLIKRLLDQGHRPGRLLSVSADERQKLAAPGLAAPVAGSEEDRRFVDQALGLLKAHDTQGLRLALNQAMMRQGLHQFVLATVTMLNQSVGDAWMRGELQIFEEHLYSEQLKSVLHQAISRLPADASSSPRILLTTLPEEQHGLGLLMAECLFTLEGATCIALGTQTPLSDIKLAATAHHADIVALSFSSAFPCRQCAPLLKQLREMLPASVELWAGGSACDKLPVIAGMLLLPTLQAGLAALKNRRQPGDHS